MTQKVFVSHSKEDEDLVKRIDEALDIIDFETIVYEEEKEKLPDEKQDEDAIIEIMEDCDACFVFPTLTVRGRKVTPAWLISESTIARVQGIPTIIFKEEDDDHEITFPFFDALVLYNEKDLPLKIQRRMQAFAGEELEMDQACRALTSAVLATSQGINGDNIFVDALLANSPEGVYEEDMGTPVECRECGKKFVYWGELNVFKCPHCHTSIIEENSQIEVPFLKGDL